MTTHTGTAKLTDIATELLGDASGNHAKRAARTIVSGAAQRATVIALRDGAEVAEHNAPPAATLLVITGRVRLHTAEQEWILDAGDLATAPPQRHGLQAIGDAAVLLTVALR